MANSTTPPPFSSAAASPSSPPRQPKMKKRVSLFGLKRRGSEGSAASDGSEPQPPTPTAASYRPASPSQTMSRAKKVVSPPPPLPISVSSPPTSPVRWTGNAKPPTPRSNTTPTSAATTFTFPTAPVEDVTAGLDDFAALRSHHNTLPRSSRRDSFESPNGGIPHHLGAPFMYDGVSASASGASRRPRSGSAPARHSRVRSHFSIPDVVVTSCEEEGEEIHFEVKLQDEKRRTRLPTNPASDGDSPTQPQSSTSRRSLGNIIKPLLGFEGEGSVLGLTGAVGADERVEHSQQEQHSAATIASPPAKRTRKTSLPMLFGRGTKGAKNDVAAVAAPPPRSSSPYSQTAFDSSGSLPSSSSRDSLHSSASSVPHSPPGDVDLVTPPDTPAAAAVSSKRPYAKNGATTPIAVTPTLSKKEQRKLREREELSRKQREKEEVMLMRELARVDKMVRQHDAKANKLRAKEEKQRSAADAGGKLPKALRRMTMFSGGNKTVGNASQPSVTAGLPAPTSGGGLVRKVSTGRRAGQSAPTSAPIRPRRPPPLYNSAAEQQQQQQQQQQQGAPVLPAPRNKDSDESERLSFSPQEWADLPQFLENNDYSSTVGSSAGLTSLAGLVEDMSLDLEPAPVVAAPVARRRSKRRSAMAANRGSMAILDGSGASTPSSSSDSRRSSASVTTLTRRRSHLLGHKETPEVEEESEEGWVESGDDDVEASETRAGRATTPNASESRCATPLARSINKANGVQQAQRYQSDPSAYVPRRTMPPSNSDPTIVAFSTPQCTSPEPLSAPPTTMSFNVGQVIPGSQVTTDFPPLAECVEREVRVRRDGAASVSPPLVPVSMRSQSPSISAAFMR